MNLSSIYKCAVELGMQKDPRSKDEIRKVLARSRKINRGLKPKYRKFFDKNCLFNPYADTRILHANTDLDINSILVGIDIEAGELLLANQLRRRQSVDLVLSHHPEGLARAAFYDVMRMQVDLLISLGISEDTAQSLVGKRMQEVKRKVLPANHQRSVDIARALDIPFMCIHTPADNHVWSFMRRLLSVKKPKTLQDIINSLEEIPEYQVAMKDNVGPRIICGNPRQKVGRISIEMTGGTEGPKEALDKLYKKGVRTLLCMHMSEDHFKKVKDIGLGVIIAGHIASDTLGLNLILDGLQRKADHTFEVIECSGFRRITRVK